MHSAGHTLSASLLVTSAALVKAFGSHVAGHDLRIAGLVPPHFIRYRGVFVEDALRLKSDGS